MPNLPHEFQDRDLLELALTHSSLGSSRDNERLEFLGDAKVEPLFEALQNGPAVRSRLAWKLFWAALVLIGLVVLAIQQSF